jgi:hypothetical protein
VIDWRERACNEVREGCQAPPSTGARTRGTCFACGLPVCVACSRRVQWFGHGRRRVCLTCIEDEQRASDRAR